MNQDILTGRLDDSAYICLKNKHPFEISLIIKEVLLLWSHEVVNKNIKNTFVGIAHLMPTLF